MSQFNKSFKMKIVQLNFKNKIRLIDQVSKASQKLRKKLPKIIFFLRKSLLNKFHKKLRLINMWIKKFLLIIFLKKIQLKLNNKFNKKTL